MQMSAISKNSTSTGGSLDGLDSPGGIRPRQVCRGYQGRAAIGGWCTCGPALLSTVWHLAEACLMTLLTDVPSKISLTLASNQRIIIVSMMYYFPIAGSLRPITFEKFDNSLLLLGLFLRQQCLQSASDIWLHMFLELSPESWSRWYKHCNKLKHRTVPLFIVNTWHSFAETHQGHKLFMATLTISGDSQKLKSTGTCTSPFRSFHPNHSGDD